MMRFTQCFLIALLYGTQLFGDIHVAAAINGTTTAVPLMNLSTSTTAGHTPSETTTIKSLVVSTDDSRQTTKAIVQAKTSDSIKATTPSTSSAIPAVTGSQDQTDRRNSETTTAAPPFVEHVANYHRFDALSFMGGSLLTICIVIIGTMAWKMYIAHVERRYWTL